MRRLIRTTGIAAAGFVLALGIAGAADRDEQTPESRAYLSLSFGGERIAPRDFHYGLRLDHDARFVDGIVPPMMQFDFTRRGLHDARLNGLSVLKQSYRLRQSEEEAAAEAGSAPAEEPTPAEAPAESAESAPAESAPAEGEQAAAEGGEAAAAEEGGFFSSMWGGVTGFFGGLFGGDEEEATETAEAPAEQPAEGAEAPPEDLAEGAFMSYGMVDWGLLALGAAGIGLAASEVANGDEDADPPGGPNAPPTTGTPGGCTGTTGTTGVPCVPGAFLPARSLLDLRRDDPEYQKWLDGGTGQMGDLGG